VNDDDKKPAENQPPEEYDYHTLAESLLDKGEEKPADEKPADEDKGEGEAKPAAEAEKTAEEIAAAEKVEADKKAEDEKAAADGKPAEEKPADGDKKPEDGDKPADDKPAEGESAEEAAKPLTREDIRAAMREEEQAREAATAERSSFSGQVRSNLKEALKLDSTYTTVALDDGTPISSVEQLTKVLNPETDEPYTREEAATLLLDARKVVDENLAAYEKRVDELTDLNVNFKEQSDEVDRKYGDILKAFPDLAQELLEGYKKTFTTDDGGKYVTNVPVSPMEYYAPVLNKFRNATDQANQQAADAKAAEEKAARDAEAKEEQEDRGDLGGTAGSAQGKPDLLGDALTAYNKDR
jgi:hypothetical protein